MVSYESKVKELIEAKRPDIGIVHDIASIKTILYSSDSYKSVVQSIQVGDLFSIQDASKTNYVREFLDLVTFSDSNGIKYLATIYDSDELWQNLEVLDIFQLKIS